LWEVMGTANDHIGCWHQLWGFSTFDFRHFYCSGWMREFC
jgi:hypothetical protein